MKVLDNRVIIKLNKSGITTRRGIIIPDKNDGVLEKGIVIVAGLKCEEVKEKDIVLINYANGREITIDNEKHIIIRETDIECIIKET